VVTKQLVHCHPPIMEIILKKANDALLYYL